MFNLFNKNWARFVFCICLFKQIEISFSGELNVSLCPRGWTVSPESGTCIRIESSTANWTQAGLTCKANEAKLLKIINADMNDFIWGILKPLQLTRPFVWIGLNNVNTSYYRWNDDSEPAEYKNLMELEHANRTGMSAIFINDVSKLWRPTFPENNFFFICERLSDLICDGMLNGMICKENCSRRCKENVCDAQTGICNGCQDGYRGDFCDKMCPDNTYGSNCLRTCSSNCEIASPLCDKKSGNCREGCLDGYFGSRCDSECPKNTYGTNCWRQCSLNCTDSECDKKDGHCLYGCNDGYFGDMCQKVCPNNTYGTKCSKICSKNCLNTSCSHVDGKCLSGCVSAYSGMWCDIPIEAMDVTKDALNLAVVGFMSAFGIAFFAVTCIVIAALTIEKALAEEEVELTEEVAQPSIVRSSSKDMEELLYESLSDELEEDLLIEISAPVNVELIDRNTEEAFNEIN